MKATLLAVAALIALALLPSQASAATCSGDAVVQPPVDRLAAALQQREVPEHQKHALATIAKGWPRILVLNGRNADDRRDRLLEEHPNTSRV